MSPQYLKRVVDTELAAKLQAVGAVVIEGPKACGKTETARQFAASEVLLDIDAEARRAAAVDPTLVLAGPTPRLIDEWQLEPRLWDHVRRAADDTGRPGQFILTGSMVAADDITRHSGAGRLTRLRMRPMSLFELGRSTGHVSFGGLLAGDESRSANTGMTVADVAEHVAVGGWPALVGRGVDAAIRSTRDYLDEIRRVDVNQVDATRRDPEKVGRLLVSLARNVATPASATTLAAGADGRLDTDTALAYLAALERLMIIEDQPAWAPHLRSKSRLRAAPKRHFVDPSLAVAALGATPERLLRDLNLLGLLFESLVVRDLRVYAQPLDARVLHYRDNTGLEVDAVVEAPDGRWAAFEVKLGSALVEQAAINLARFAARVDMQRSGAPAVLAVITASGYGYVRPDGIAVVPIGSLGP